MPSTLLRSLQREQVRMGYQKRMPWGLGIGFCHRCGHELTRVHWVSFDGISCTRYECQACANREGVTR